MRTPTQFIHGLAVAAIAALASSALAGDAVRLSVEPPKGVTTVEAGDPGIDVQIVGIDAVGARVGFGGKTVEVSATDGDLTLVTAPYGYRYVPPASVDASKPLKLSAWLKQTPDVRGEANLTLARHRPFERLLLVAGSTSLSLGTSTEIEIRGVRADGRSVVVSDQKIVVTADGVGKLEAISQALYKYSAPGKGETKMIGATAHLRAALESYPGVYGELSVVIAGEAPPPSPGGGTPTPKPPTPVPPVPTPTPPAPTPAPPTAGDDTVLWPDGAVRVMVWRTKAAAADEFGKKERDLPPAGKPFIAMDAFHRVRVQIERDDVRKVELEWFVGDKKGAPLHFDDADKEGHLRVQRTKAGKLDAVMEFETPENKPLIVNLLLTTSKGEILKEEFVFEKGKDRDDDGEKDKRKKK